MVSSNNRKAGLFEKRNLMCRFGAQEYTNNTKNTKRPRAQGPGPDQCEVRVNVFAYLGRFLRIRFIYQVSSNYRIHCFGYTLICVVGCCPKLGLRRTDKHIATPLTWRIAFYRPVPRLPRCGEAAGKRWDYLLLRWTLHHHCRYYRGEGI